MTRDAELTRLEEEVERLRAEIGHLRKRKTLAELCAKKPYTAIRYNDEKGVPYFSRMRSDEWKAMVEMAKGLFLNDRQIMGERYESITKNPKKISEMTPEQRSVAARFLDEVVSVFNRYFMEINKNIIFKNEPYEVTEVEE